MKKVKVLWYGQSKSGNHYVLVEVEMGDFFISKFIKCSGKVDYEKGQEIEVPTSAL